VCTNLVDAINLKFRNVGARASFAIAFNERVGFDMFEVVGPLDDLILGTDNVDRAADISNEIFGVSYETCTE
jgi:hypothetical protein